MPDDTAPTLDLTAAMAAIGANARASATALRLASAEHRSAALTEMARALRRDSAAILDANARDVAAAQDNALSPAMIDRLMLNEQRLNAIAAAVDETAAQPDPVGAVIAEWRRPNGLHFQRVRTPLGVIGLIFESRPNVAADAGALCVRSGNAAILRGGADSAHSVRAIVHSLRTALTHVGLPADAIQVAPSTDRAVVGLMLAGLDGAIDVLVPRGGKSLVARVQSEARVPVFAHLEGLCHTYIHTDADHDQAIAITLNAKMRRVSVCGATETILLDAAIAPLLLPKLAAALEHAGCALRGDERARAIAPMAPASEADFKTEYLDAIVSIAVVDDLDAAIDHIARYGSQHTDAILTQNTHAAESFLARVDSAIVLVNASTQFADGGEFGFGGEIGIATGRMHARGPVGAEQLTTFNYRVRGAGQTRP